MDFDLDPKDSTPLSMQLARALRRLIALGALRPGDQVPPVRDLAVRARVNRNTAARAIQQLEADGVVRTRVGQGTFVEDGAARLGRRERDDAVDGALDRLVVETSRLGFPLEDLPQRLARRVERFRRQQTQEKR